MKLDCRDTKNHAEKTKIPVISITGNPFELGYQHGNQAKEAIRENILFYLDLWKYFGNVGCNQVLRDAQMFIPYIETFDPELLEELRGIAEGSKIQFEEIIALNCRWEMTYAYMSHAQTYQDGCTAYALTPQSTKNQHTFIGQNWDYKPKSLCIILKIHQNCKPDIIAHTEAGIIGQKGFNSKGIGVCINYIRCDKDVFHAGLPVWIKVRGILNSVNFPDCLKILSNFGGPNSVNLIVANRDGEAIDVESTPDDTFFLYPQHGILTHTNHFLSSGIGARDTGKTLLPDTVIRNHRAFQLLKDKRENLQDDAIKDVLKDHFGHPNSICRHRDDRVHPNEQWETLTSIIIDLTKGKMLYTNGPPCSNPYEIITMGDNRSGS